jgi:hypothetical protein
LWKFIGAQPTEHTALAQKRDFVHMAVAVSHFCNIKNVFLADNVVEAGDQLYLVIDPPPDGVEDANIYGDHDGEAYYAKLQNMCLRPYVTKHRAKPVASFWIYVGIASLMYGTQFNERDPYKLRDQARNAIRSQDRDEQRRVLDGMPTLDVMLRR